MWLAPGARAAGGQAPENCRGPEWMLALACRHLDWEDEAGGGGRCEQEGVAVGASRGREDALAHGPASRPGSYVHICMPGWANQRSAVGSRGSLGAAIGKGTRLRQAGRLAQDITGPQPRVEELRAALRLGAPDLPQGITLHLPRMAWRDGRSQGSASLTTG